MNTPPPPGASPLVVKLGGAALENPAERAELWRALGELHVASGVVLVHGGGEAVDRHLARLGFVSERREGLRLTPPEHIDEVVAVLAGRVNKRLVGALLRQEIPGVGVCLGDGMLADVRKLVRAGFCVGRVGVVAGGEGRLLRTLLGDGFLPVVSSIGLDGDGEALNVNADDAAVGVARILGARGLVLLTDVDGIRGEDGRVIEQIDGAGVESLIASGVIEGGMIPKARGAVEAAARSGSPVFIASWKRPGELPRLAGGTGVGTRVFHHGGPRSGTEGDMGTAQTGTAGATRT